MTEPSGTPPSDELNFDRALPAADAAHTVADGKVWCASCRRPLTTEYHTANGAPLCGDCRALYEAAAQPVSKPALLTKSALFGLGAAVVGAVIYWAVMKFLNLEIGLVAILTGWMVGRSVRTGADGRGGRLLQVGAAVLVYLSVAMAYFPFVLGQAGANAGLLDVGLLAFALTVPVRAILASMPGGLISAAIIGFGMHQAWQLTAAPQFSFEGPLRLGGSTS